MAAFGGLYLTEGLPQGFAGVALTLEFKRRGMDAAAIGAFSGMILLPWSWKFLMGPLVDNLHIPRFGARKQWIVMAQTGMLFTLAIALMNMPTFTGGGIAGLGLFTTLMIIMNIFAATHFTALMAMLNLVISYTWFWQGQAISTDAWNWSLVQILLADSVFGLLFLVVIPFVKLEQDRS